MTNFVGFNVDQDLPIRSREYRNYRFDSTVWDNFEPRNDDIIISTTFKAGTTWMQQILAMLIFQGEDPPMLADELSIWVDMRVPPREEKITKLQQQKHRRFLKTHLPLDGILFYPQCKYIYVGRDGRDVFMRLFNHYSNYNDLPFKTFNDTPGRMGDLSRRLLYVKFRGRSQINCKYRGEVYWGKRSAESSSASVTPRFANAIAQMSILLLNFGIGSQIISHPIATHCNYLIQLYRLL